MVVPPERRASLRQLLRDEFTEQAVALGLVEGVQSARIEGYAFDIDSSDWPSTIFPAAGAYPYQTTGQQLEIVCANASDADGGTGARELGLFGLDSNWDPVFELIALDGTTPVQTVSTDFMRLNLAFVTRAGTFAQNHDNITITAIGSGDELGFIGPNWARTRNCVGAASNAATGTITQVSIGFIRSPATSVVEVGVYVRDNTIAEPAWTLQAAFGARAAGSSTTTLRFDSPILIPSCGDIEVRLISSDSNNVGLLARMEGFLIDNDILTDAP